MSEPNEPAIIVVCPKEECGMDYNSRYHKSCPYCTPGIINPLKK